MNKKQMDTKKVNKKLSKKVGPLVLSTSVVAAAFLAARVSASAAELDTKGVHSKLLNK